MSLQKDNQGEVWEVFIQSKPGLPHKHVGNVHATDKEMALHNARDLYTRRQEGSSIWVVPGNQIVASMPDDAESFFDPSDDKTYRHPTYYIMPEGAQHI
jgi:ring-1,2-phenylacetyl-CoA epoxidase subunit PaaB